MQDVAVLNAENDALKSENSSLKEVISRNDSQIMALDQTVKEVLNANIAFKAGCHMLEKQINTMTEESNKKDAIIKMVNDQLDSARIEIESLKNESHSVTLD